MNFYILYNPRFDDSLYAYGEKIGNANLGDAIKCTECGTFLTMLKWLPPYEIRLSKKTIGDFIYGTYTGFIISKRFKDAFEVSELNGLSDFKKVNPYYRNQILEEQYFYPELAMSSAKVNLNKSEIKINSGKICGTCQIPGRDFDGFNGVYFIDPDKIKEDIFFTMALGQATIIVSEKFKNFAESKSFTNLKLIDAHKYKKNIYTPIKY